MGEGDLIKGMFEAPGFVEKQRHWMNMEDDVVTSTSESSLGEESRTSNGSSSTSSSSELVDDASSTNCNGPLCELSDLMAQLPIKRGLSQYFQGKTQSFTSLSSVKTIEELAKKENPYRKKMKACKSYGGGLDRDSHRVYTLPRATISKKVSRNNYVSSLTFPARRSSFLSGAGTGRPPLIPAQKNF